MKVDSRADPITDRDRLSRLFSNLAGADFKELAPPLMSTRTAHLYVVTIDDGREFLIKKFFDKYYFKKERDALVGLLNTGRVADIIFDSTHLEGYSDTDGPFFIVKPFFPRFLKEETNGFLLLDQAVQEADISDKFMSAGWRDMDGNPTNDAIDRIGKIVRVDLDAVYPCAPPVRKFDDAYHTKRAKELRDRIRADYEDLFSPQMELLDLAQRLSQLFLRQVKIPIIDEIHALTISPDSNGTDQRKKQSFIHKYMRSVWPFKPKPDQPFEQLKNKWLSTWDDKLTNFGGLDRSLNWVEVKFLSLLFWHLLNESEPGFSIRDLYFSLMLLLVAAVRQRVEGLDQAAQAGIKQLVRSLSELIRFSEVNSEVKVDSGESTKDSVPVVANTRISHFSFYGKSWAVTGKGEDIVLDYSNAPCPLFVLADGATGAGGKRAIQIVKEICDEWADKLVKDSVSRIKELLGNLVLKVQERLVAQAEQDGNPCETTLVFIMLCPDAKPTPVALLGRFGNSEYVVTYEDDAHNIETIPNTKRAPAPLGAWRELFRPDREITTLSLGKSGTYRLRAFSDGIPRESPAIKRIVSGKSIKDLVTEAEHWNKESPLRIGDDDWSLAGFDVIADEGIPSNVERISSQPQKTVSLEFIVQVQHDRFPLSEAARNLWQCILSADPTLTSLAKYPVIRDFVTLPRSDEISSAVQISPQPVRATQSTATPAAVSPSKPVSTQKIFITTPQPNRVGRNLAGRRKGLSKRSALFIGILVLIALVTFLLVAKFGPSIVPGNKILNATENANRNQGTPSGVLQFSNEYQRNIHETLAARKPYEVDGIQSGYKVDRPPLSTLILDLAEVLAKTHWNIIIEVHTDQSGTVEDNQRTSELRGQLIQEQLLKNKSLTTEQITFLGRGESDPKIKTEQTSSDSARNRRIVIRQR